jgi:hypothetical protein
MTDTFNYSFVKNDEGAFSLRSTVKSFNLDHVTDKDIVSFYHSFSTYASFDTGLLPLNGTGVLAIRTAGPHTQIVTQHAAGMYYVNWGAHEGDSKAKAYYVAQPYRVVIGDFENGNLLGARMFYSPYPITSPNNLLYHVNLPNINCKGYRGNGVGWICLYHKDDWSNLPFNEKVSRFIERCSGVETYNDANMSETDGARFYAARSKPSYISDPALWQQKSEEGFEWTLDEDLWIPVLVQDIDHQDKHYDDGEPLTLAMAMLGNYQAYYSDKNIPKMYNVISRSDLSLTNNNIADFIKKSFASAPVVYQHQKKDDPYSFTVQHRNENGSSVLAIPTLFDENNSTSTCEDCEDEFNEDELTQTYYDTSVCETCLSNSYTYHDYAEKWFSFNDDSLVWSEESATYYHTDYDCTTYCHHCDNSFGTYGLTQSSKDKHNQKVYWNQNSEEICLDCFNDMVEVGNAILDMPNQPFSLANCFSCSKKVIDTVGWSTVYPTFNAAIPDFESGTMTPSSVTFCPECAKNHYVCPCGLIKQSSENLVPCTPTTFDLDDKNVTVLSCCQSCIGNATEENGMIIMKYKPFNEEITATTHNVSILNNAMGVSVSINLDLLEDPF